MSTHEPACGTFDLQLASYPGSLWEGSLGTRLVCSDPFCALAALGVSKYVQSSQLPSSRCPRFILHRRHNAPLHTSQPHPSTSSTTATPFFRSFSTTPVALHTITPSHPHSSTSPKHPKLPSPFTPTQTPTFRKLTSVRPRSKSSPTNYQNKIQEEHPSDRNDGNHQPTKSQTVSFGDNRTSNLPSIAMPFHCEATSTASQRPHTVDTASIRPPVRGKSRKVWHKQSPHKEGQNQSPLTHFSQLAKYTQHHLPDVNSRCASVLVSQTCAGYYTATAVPHS